MKSRFVNGIWNTAADAKIYSCTINAVQRTEYYLKFQYPVEHSEQQSTLSHLNTKSYSLGEFSFVTKRQPSINFSSASFPT